MTFLDALKAARDNDSALVRVFRSHGPALRIDDLGAVTGDLSAAYLADFLDLDDWEIEPVKGSTWGD